MPTIADYISLLDEFTPEERIQLDEQAIEIAGEHIDLVNPDQWEELGWTFARRSKEISAAQGPDKAIGGLGLAAWMFVHAERLRSAVH